MTFLVKGREIFYTDRVFNQGIRCIPKDEAFMRKIIMSRNRYSQRLIEMFSLSKKSEEEYNNAKTSEELAEIIIKDCNKKGLVLLKKEVVEDANV